MPALAGNRGHRLAAYRRCSADPEVPARAWQTAEERMDRKELIRQYKETPRPMGVFRVHDTVADRSFVGTSRDLPSMLNRQRFQLEHGSHPNRELQEDWNRLGAGAFAFEVVDTLKPSEQADSDSAEDLRVLGDLWLERLLPYGARGYNGAQKPDPRS
jgi:hypothetical protein